LYIILLPYTLRPYSFFGGQMSTPKSGFASKAKPVEIHFHWPKLIENLQFSSREFYSQVLAAVEKRKIPDLKIRYVRWSEGSLLSPERIYLRLTRERLSFDICGAEFGTGFFVSLWCGEKPLRLGFLLFVAAVIALLMFFNWPVDLYRYTFRTWGLSSSETTECISIFLIAFILAIIIRAGPNLDAFLIGIPVIGYFYERFFRKITYYRVDRMCMYEQAVWASVMEVIDEITRAKGIAPLSESERRPIMRELFGSGSLDGRGR
jgi:hypothetical protein